MRICKICGGQVRIIPNGKQYIDMYNRLIIYGIGFGCICMPCALKFKQNINGFQTEINHTVQEKLDDLKRQLGITNKQADETVKKTMKNKKKMKIVDKLTKQMGIDKEESDKAKAILRSKNGEN